MALLRLYKKGTSGGGGGGVQSVNGDIVDNADPSNPTVNQVQADWDQADSELPSFIANKPNVNNLGYIPISGTQVNEPVTGDVAIFKDVKITSADGNFTNEITVVTGGNCIIRTTNTLTSVSRVYQFSSSGQFLNSVSQISDIKRVIWAKAGAPALTDDNTAGFVIGSLLWDSTNLILYRATNVTTGAAAWVSAVVNDGNKGDITVASNGTAWTVTRLQGRAVAAIAPTTGQLLVWDGSAWTPTTRPTVYQASNTNGDTVSAGTTYYALTNPITDSSTQNARFTLMTHNGQVRRMRVLTTSAQPATLTTVFTLQRNGADTAMTFTISPSAAAQTFSMSGAPIAFVDGDTLGYKVVSTGSGTSATFGAMTILIENTEVL